MINTFLNFIFIAESIKKSFNNKENLNLKNVFLNKINNNR